MRNKRITRIHSPDSVNDKNWLNRPKMDNFWFKKITIYIKFFKTFRSLDVRQFQKFYNLNMAFTEMNNNKQVK